MRRTVRLREGELRRMIAESVRRVLNESGNTKRGQYMLGRLKNRQSNGGGKFFRGTNYNDAGDYAYETNGNSYSNDYQKGYDDEEKLNAVKHDRSLQSSPRRNIQFNYDVYKMEDMEALGRKFIDFIEKHDGGVLMQTVVDYESGNQTGKKESPLKELIPYFEEEVLGYDCTPDMIDAIRRAYNQWWFYAEDQLMPYDEEEESVDESINRKINRIVSDCLKRRQLYRV